jgi:hypothetical protein
MDSGGKLHGRESQEVDLGVTLIIFFSPHDVPTDIPTLLAIQNLHQ